MTITHMLAGFPDYNQLSSPTLDGQPDENARLNCVATSVADTLTYYTGKRYLPDEVKDAVYGQGHVGVMAAKNFVAYMRAHGVDLVPFNAPAGTLAYAQTRLVEAIRAAILAGDAVIATIPSAWGTPPEQLKPPQDPRAFKSASHVGVFCGAGVSELRFANPWGGFFMDQPDQYWRDRLVYGQVWIARPIAHSAPAPTGQASGAGAAVIIPAGWKWNAATGELTAPNGKTLGHGIAYFVATYPGGWQAWNWPLETEQDRTPVEEGNPSLGGGAFVRFRACQVSWTQARGAFETWTGQELLAITGERDAARAQAAQLQQQVTDLTAKLAAAQQAAQQAVAPAAPAAPTLSPADQKTIAAAQSLHTALAQFVNDVTY